MLLFSTGVLAQAEVPLAAGTDYVSVARSSEASDLLGAVRAATEGLLDEKRTTLKDVLAGREEVPG